MTNQSPYFLSAAKILPFLAMIFITACASNQNAVVASTVRTTPLVAQAIPSFTLVPGDEIDIKYADRSDLNETMRVRPDGYIDLAVVGTMRAYGRMPEELSTAIRDAYRALGTGTAQASDVSYLLNVGDELEVRLPNHTGMDQIIKVRPDGRISLALAGTVQAQGISPETLEAELNRRYALHFRKPNVSVSVRNFLSSRVSIGGRFALASVSDLKPVVQLRTPIPRQIFIGGEVAHPGVLTHRYALSAIQAIVEAGGLKSASAGANVAILRRSPEGLKLIPIDASMLSAVNLSVPNDIMLEPFDIVVVPKAPLAAVADAVDQVFNLLPPLRNSTFSTIYQIDKGNVANTAVTVNP